LLPHVAEQPVFEPKILIAAPLFAPTRTPARPVEPAPPEAPPPPPTVAAPMDDSPMPTYSVAGIVFSPGLRKALLRRDRSDSRQWLSQGESTSEGWTVSSISPEEVVLSRGARVIRLPLHHRARSSREVAGR
jgi:hypothetical protein